MTVRALMIWAAGCLEACGIGEAAAEAAADEVSGAAARQAPLAVASEGPA